VAEEANWRAALRASSGRLGALSLLLSLVVEWGHDPQDLLWQIGEQFPREQWALLELERRYQASGNTRGLNKVYSAKIENVPGAPDLTNRNNFAVSSMLLRINLGKAYDIARDLYKRLPEDPIIASTYGYSLHLQGRTEEGLAVFGKLKPESVEIPSVALYYGVLLSAAGRPYEAERYLALAQAAHLLPEENQLLSKAKSRTP
jgi:tetratricopeptide (TPR) repeat protein